ncbi:MAG: hypothetical protein AB7E36_08125 [Salinivirgaceae bacterium]
MKLHILLFGFLISQIAVGQVDKTLLRGDWVAVEYRQNDTIDNETLFGLILSFDEQGLEYFSLWDDSTIFLTYTELDSLEKVSNSTFFQFANSDSLIIGDSTTTILYYPMKSSKSKISKKEFDDLLIEKTWKLSDTTFTNIKFVNYLPSDFLPKRLETYLVSDKNGFFQYVDYWLSFLYNDNLFLAFSLNDNFNIYHIINATERKVEYDIYSKNPNQSFSFNSEEKLNEPEYSKLQGVLCSEIWKSIKKTPSEDYYHDLNFGLYYLFDSSKVEILPNIIHHSENYPNFLKYMAFNTSFMFGASGDYKIFKGKKTYDKGKWKLSKDGLYIILNPATNNEFYLRVLEITESEMIIGQTLALPFDKKDNERGIVNFRVKMKN